MQTDFVSPPRVYTFALAAIFLAFSSISAPAQEQPIRRLSPLPDRIQDVERPESLISASHWLRGLYLASEPSGQRPRLLGAIPEAWRASTICARAVTINGRYEFSAEYAIPADWSAGMAELEYPTSFGSAWSAATMADSGVAISEGPCSGPDDDHAELVPALWNGETAAVDSSGRQRLVVNLHARAAQEIAATALLDQRMLEVDCERIDRPDAAQFNFACTIFIPQGSAGQLDFQYVRLNGGRASESRGALFLLAGRP